LQLNAWLAIESVRLEVFDSRCSTKIGRMPNKPSPENAKLDRVVAEARRNAEQRDKGYRERALKMYPWICGRCAREFTRANLQELTVHHRNHDHDFNPPDGSNWELLCVYCHDNEHSRYIDHIDGDAPATQAAPAAATGNPFADLKALLQRKS
jgi:5-methylcytosine-specific restriction endonuclease McrA